MMFKTNGQLKSQARFVLKDQWGKAVLLNIVVILFVIFSLNVTRYIYSQPSGQGEPNIQQKTKVVSPWNTAEQRNRNKIRPVYGVLFLFLLFFLSLGPIFTFIDIYRQKKQDMIAFSDAFQLFRQPDLLPQILLQALLLFFTTLWSLLLFIPGLIKWLAYSQASFIYRDMASSNHIDNRKIRSFITESRALMNGHKSQLFSLIVSFFGWFLFVYLTAGLASIYVVPYFNATIAAFYQDVAKERYLLLDRA